ncbi:MAG TPA: hypothetical protein VFD63_12595 [Pyrinomonadaceae bacterium]|nr:hypothetical protein [Pyrinomonadaceae bacterium]
MRRFLSVFLIIPLVSSFGAGSHAATNPLQQQQESVKALTNQDILTLVKSGLSAEVISAKLLRSGCTCDISTPELLRLKAEGVADEILFAMIKSTKAGSGERIMVTIPRDTVVEIETVYRISSQEIRAGEAISFKVVNPVQVGGNTVIAAGAIATGRVVQASRGGHFGRAGRLAWKMESVNAVDDSRIPIQAPGRIVGDSKGAKVATQVLLTGALLWPIAPVALLHGFKRGGNAYLAQGRRYEVTVSSDTTIKLSSLH